MALLDRVYRTGIGPQNGQVGRNERTPSHHNEATQRAGRCRQQDTEHRAPSCRNSMSEQPGTYPRKASSTMLSRPCHSSLNEPARAWGCTRC